MGKVILAHPSVTPDAISREYSKVTMKNMSKKSIAQLSTTKSARSLFVLVAGLAFLAPIVAGCDDNNRVPTKTEVQAADVNRQSFIDKMNIPESQKAMMKSHMGGPPVENPAAAAQAAAGAQKPANRR